MIPTRLSATLVLILGPMLAMAADLVIVPDPRARPIDLTNYGLGQGGYTDLPMLQPYLDDLRQLHPQIIRLFVQEYYDLLPEKGRYDWRKLDRELEAIVATGARPMLCLCMKPRLLYPVIDEKVVHPSSYPEWEQFIEQLVRHVNLERKFAVQYWEIGNEVEIGERGGCPYLFTPEDYLVYYTRTAQAVVRADPTARIGGPALGHYDHPIGDALLAHAAAGKAPLHFFSFHTYDNDPEVFRTRIRNVKARIAKYPQLKDVETNLDEWNMSLSQPVADPAFQPAFALTVIRMMAEEGLTRAAYYNVRDCYADPATLGRFLSPPTVASTVRFFDVLPTFLGLYDIHGRMRPTYYAFKMMAQVQGKQWNVSGSDPRLFGMAAETQTGLEVIFWNFCGPQQKPEPIDVAVRLGEPRGARFKLIRLNPHTCVNNLEIQRSGPMSKPPDPLQVRLEPYGIRWLTIEW